MSEHMSPIPSRIYNAAVGGHVAGADQIIDDETGLTLDKVTGGALEEKTYTSGSDNGMGRVVLRKNLVEGVNTLVQTMINNSNTIFVIQYDFTISGVSENIALNFTSSNVSGVMTPEKIELDAATAAYNADPTDANLARKNRAQAAYESIGSQNYYYWASYTIPSQHCLHLTNRAIRLNDSKNAQVPTKYNQGIIYAPKDESLTVYIGNLNGQYNYIKDGYIEIPDGCVLEFEGGSISGNTLDLNDCQIVAPNICVFKNVTFGGTNNNLFNLCWLIEGDDITDVINKLPITIKKIVFNSNKTYYIHNAVTFSGISYLDWNVIVYYNGTVSNISVIKLISLSNGTVVKFRGWLAPIDETTAVNQITDNTNVVGLEICNTHNSTFYIGNIGYFNENVRISAIGQGCCNNKFIFSHLTCGNRQLRIYQENANGDIGWANENYFYGGHFQVYNSWKRQGKKATAIHIEGAQREGGTDTYNGCNALKFDCFNLEGHGGMNGYTIYANNVVNSDFIHIRNEGGNNFLKVVGDCRNIGIISSFGSESVDYSDNDRLMPLATRYFTFSSSIRCENVGSYLKDTNHASYVTSDLFCEADLAHVWWNTGTSFTGICFEYAPLAGRIISLKQSKGVCGLAFIKNGVGNVLPWPSPKAPFNKLSGSTYYSQDNTYDCYFIVPIGVDADYIWISVRAGRDYTGPLEISSTGRLTPVRRDMPTKGLYADIPTLAVYGAHSLAVGQEYYCTDTKKKLICDGTNWLTTDGTNP